MSLQFRRLWPVMIPAISLAAPVFAQQNQGQNQQVQEIVVTGAARTYSALSTTQSMRDQQNPISSVLSTIDNLPGVNITEGDTFGFDDWSTTVNLRGYQTSLGEQQVGTYDRWFSERRLQLRRRRESQSLYRQHELRRCGSESGHRFY